MESEKLEIVKLINEFFGDMSWSLSICNSTLDYVDQDTRGLFSAGAVASVRLQLTSGLFREDIGYGSSFARENKAEAISKAREVAVIAGLKGAFTLFGGDLMKSSLRTTPLKADVPKVMTSPHVPAKGPQQQVKQNVASSEVPEVKSSVTSAQSLNVNSKPSSVSKLTASSQCVAAHAQNSAVPKQNSSPVSKVLSVMDQQCGSTSVVAPASPPLVFPLPSLAGAPLPLEEEQAKAERIRRSKLKQEEFKKRLLLQQAQNKGIDDPAQDQNCLPLESELQLDTKTERPRVKTQLNGKDDTRTNVPAAFVDDDLLMSTQMEAVLESAVTSVGSNSSNARRTCSVIPLNSVKRPRH